MTGDLEHVPAHGGIVPLAVDFDDLMRKAAVLAESGLVRKPLQGNPSAVAAVALRGAELGVKMMTALDEIDVIEGKTYLSAQLCSSLVRAAGHVIELVHQDREHVVMRARRREGGEWQQVEWTRERAREAGLLDVWVEKWLKKDGETKSRPYRFVIGNDLGIDPEKVAAAPPWATAIVGDASLYRRKDNWWKHPTEMLRARCTRELSRIVFGDVLIGLDVVADDDEVLDVLDASTIDDQEPVDAELLVHRGGEPAPDGDEEPVDAVIVPPAGAAPSGEEFEVDDDLAPIDGDPLALEAASWSAEQWSEHFTSLGVTDAKALRHVRKVAENLGVERPLAVTAAGSIDLRLVAALLDLDGEA